MRLDDPTATRIVGGNRSAAEILVEIAEAATVFRDTAYADLVMLTHRETWPVRSKSFRRWLAGIFYKQEGKPPGGQAVADALAVIEARAQYEGAVRPVHVRVAGDDRAIYLDLANATWQAIEITAVGWRVVSDPPVRFRRARGMLPLPLPLRGGPLAELRDFVNIGGEDQWSLLMAWLVAALRPTGPYPVLALLGEQGTSKSTTQEVFRALVDPNVAPLRAEPRDIRDVMIAASNGWFVALDNLSDIAPWLSDTLCRLSTGGGFSTRELYSDDDERIFVATRPVMVNGIDAVISRADLLDRALIVDLPRIPAKQRRQRQAFWHDFESARPSILVASSTPSPAPWPDIPKSPYRPSHVWRTSPPGRSPRSRTLDAPRRGSSSLPTRATVRRPTSWPWKPRRLRARSGPWPGGRPGKGRRPSSWRRSEASPLRRSGGRRAGQVAPAYSAAPFVAWSHPSERSASW